ncbi:MAG TPA: DUF2934 domain-containing protein [Terracidiphilus sp.]|nr:DUF2934 domain-containing protein [Terracidiphilus sp.]
MKKIEFKAAPAKKATAAKKKSSTAVTKEVTAMLPATKKATPSKVTVMKQRKVSHEEIARLAHRLWAERGGQHGHDADDWFRAEQALRSKAS